MPVFGAAAGAQKQDRDENKQKHDSADEVAAM
jgi:hypothetical protein